jgi:membrane-associated protease RseP (regulator of RpoE activity)
LPLGGFVAFPNHTEKDDNGKETVNDDPDLLQNRPLLDRAIVISAGVIANCILAYAAIFTSVNVVGTPKYDLSPGVIVQSLVDASGSGARAGVRPGDVILSVNGKPVGSSLDAAGELAKTIRTSGGASLNFGFLRDGSQFDKQIRPRLLAPAGDSAMGVQLIPNAVVSRVHPTNAPDAVFKANAEFARLGRMQIAGLSSIVSNFKETSSSLSGPIGVVAMGANLAANEQTALFTFIAIVSKHEHLTRYKF